MDTDGDPIASFSFDQTALPAGDLATFDVSGTGSRRDGILRWTTSTIGTFALTFTAADDFGMSASQTASARVHSRRPEIAAPSVVSGRIYEPLSFDVTVSDPDGDPIASLVAKPWGGAALYPPPANPGFFTSADNTSGRFTWSPTERDAFGPNVFPIPIWIEATDGDLTARAIVQVALSVLDYDRFDPNACDVIVGNGAQMAFDPYTRQAGFHYPKASPTTVVYAMGPLIAGKKGNTLLISRGGIESEFFAGSMTGTGPTPMRASFRNYQLRRDDPNGEDQLHWPVDDGAPVDAQGNPALLGDRLIWSVSNDADLGYRIFFGTEWTGHTLPLGVELRQSTFAFAAPGPAANIVFVRYAFTNRSGAQIDSVTAGFWSDPDIGGATDDLVGCDPSLNLGFAYNAPGIDAQYGSAAPAFGTALVESPVPGVPAAAAFQVYDRLQTGGVPVNVGASWVLMQGRNRDGSTLHEEDDPTAPTTTYRFDGDPVSGTGWLDTQPGDKRIMISTAPFALSPDETKEFTAALIVGDGGSHTGSVAALRSLARVARYIAASGYQLKPYIDLPGEVVVAEGSPLHLAIPALDLDGDALTSFIMDARGLPLGTVAHFAVNSTFNEGVLDWTPGYGDAGVYTIRFVASNTEAADFDLTVRVLDANRAPHADTGGPYAGVAGVPIAMTASGSSDPDGQALSYHWTFGDGTEGAGAEISKTYQVGGTYAVILQVSDGTATAEESTTATIAAVVEARAFGLGGQTTIRLANRKPTHCFQLEAVAGSFTPADIAFGTITLISRGTGVTDSIAAVLDKATPLADHDENGTLETTVCFSKDNLRQLFQNLPTGATPVDAALEGRLTSGARFRAPLRLTVFGSSSLAASMAPNPLNPAGVLTFRTMKDGRIRVAIFDVSGRMVRTLLDERRPAGFHDVSFDGSSESGGHLPSGIYFYAIDAPDGSTRGKFSVLK